MKLSEYKEKGILEAYVLGVLDPETSEMLKSDLETNLALREELNKVEKNLENFKLNFTRQQKSKSRTTQQKAGQPKRSGTEKSIRIVLGILVLVLVVMLFYLLSTIYETNKYRSQISELAVTIDSLQQEIQHSRDLNLSLNKAVTELISGAATITEFRGTGDYLQRSAYLLSSLSKSTSDFLIIDAVPQKGENTFLQLWSESNGQFRRVGSIQFSSIKDGWIVHPLPKTHLQLSHISVESGTPPSIPLSENIIFVPGL